MLWWYAPSVVVRAGYLRGWPPPCGTYNGYHGILSYSLRLIPRTATRAVIDMHSNSAQNWPALGPILMSTSELTVQCLKTGALFDKRRWGKS
eukprot:1124041-Prymnesium_polylepis.1